MDKRICRRPGPRARRRPGFRVSGFGQGEAFPRGFLVSSVEESNMAGSVNKVILVGNLGKDPKVANLNSGDAVVSFTLATSETWKDKNTGERREKTEWHNIVVLQREHRPRRRAILQEGHEGLPRRPVADAQIHGPERRRALYRRKSCCSASAASSTLLDSRGGGGGEGRDDYGGAERAAAARASAAARRPSAAPPWRAAAAAVPTSTTTSRSDRARASR